MVGDLLVYMAEELEEVVQLVSKAGHPVFLALLLGLVVVAYLVYLVVLMLQGLV